MSFSHSILVEVADTIFRAYFRPFDFILRRLSRLLGFDLSINLEYGTRKPIDARIAKIDEAKANLEEALVALGQLSDEAERNKAELSQALDLLEDTRAAHATEAQQLSQIKNIAQADIEAFRKLAGIASTRERIIGFVAGIFASLVAAGIWHLGVHFVG